MINISEENKVNCCGCTACFNICPTKAITMQEDEEGFLYPVVDEEKCVNCNMCEKVCPVINPKVNSKLPKAYATRIKDDDILETSTSGGFFTPLAEYVLKNNGIVVGVAFGEDYRVEHLKIDNSNKERIKDLRGSKYVQSYLGKTFQEVKKLLEENRLVLFTGTPCQLQGLNNYLAKDYENLITMDLICHGVPSPKLWDLYVKYQQNKYKSKIKEIHFRNKTYGYHSGTMKLVFNNNKKYYGSARVDYMLKSFFTEISSRPSCYQCAFKNKRHVCDFTVFDCWHISDLVQGMKDDDKGYTNVFVNTEKGKDILEKIEKNIDTYEIDINKAISLDGPMVEKSAVPNQNRKMFYQTLNKEGIEKTIRKYINISYKDKMIELSKKILYNTNMLEKIKKIK